MSAEERDGPSWRDRWVDGARADSLDYGCTIGVAFSSGAGESRQRVGYPMSRETAEKLFRDLARLLSPVKT